MRWGWSRVLLHHLTNVQWREEGHGLGNEDAEMMRIADVGSITKEAERIGGWVFFHNCRYASLRMCAGGGMRGADPQNISRERRSQEGNEDEGNEDLKRMCITAYVSIAEEAERTGEWRAKSVMHVLLTTKHMAQ